MKTRIWLTAMCLAFTACGDDDGGTDGEPVVDGGGTDSGAYDNVACNPSGTGACQNAGDCPKVIDGSARMAAQTCGRGCLGDADASKCGRECVVKETSISDACATCYVDIVGCTTQMCLGECIADSNSQECFDCQVDKGCRSAFDTCSGLPPAKRP